MLGCRQRIRLFKASLLAADIIVTVAGLIIAVRSVFPWNVIVAIAIVAVTVVLGVSVYRELGRVSRSVESLERVLDGRYKCLGILEILVWRCGDAIYCYSPVHDRGSSVRLDKVERVERAPILGGLGFVCAAPLGGRMLLKSESTLKFEGPLILLSPEGSIVRGSGLLNYYFGIENLLTEVGQDRSCSVGGSEGRG